LLVVFCAAGCTGIKGSGKLKEETREVEAFTKVSAGGAFNLEIAVGKETSLQLSGDDNLLPLVKTEVVDGELRLTTKQNVRPDLPLTAKISTKELSAVGLSGACRIKAAGLSGESFSLRSSGATTAQLKGEVDRLEIALSGAGKVMAPEVKAKKVKIVVSGAGKAAVHASEALDVSLSGAGKVVYSGDPKKVTQNISGVGKLVKK